ncbi:spore coat protein [Brevibacillus fulvus]|uniref:Spore coat protein n=1 Tax=Brevibacillus fulvus TaxID=1125967 RepID=A0A938XYW2_9BACL|nr:spore coat protein [Brevibacillus fulvus]MBM7588417.1 hypothetical protein [Brevibacillus fulvus]
MPSQSFAPHECLDVHEIIGFKTICAEKAQVYLSQVNSTELRSLIQQDLQVSRQHLQQFQQIFGQ